MESAEITEDVAEMKSAQLKDSLMVESIRSLTGAQSHLIGLWT